MQCPHWHPSRTFPCGFLFLILERLECHSQGPSHVRHNDVNDDNDDIHHRHNGPPSANDNSHSTTNALSNGAFTNANPWAFASANPYASTNAIPNAVDDSDNRNFNDCDINDCDNSYNHNGQHDNRHHHSSSLGRVQGEARQIGQRIL